LTSLALAGSTPPSIHNEAGNIMESPANVQATNDDEFGGHLSTFSEMTQKLKERNQQLKAELASTKEQLKAVDNDNSRLAIQWAETTDKLKDENKQVKNENQQLKDKVQQLETKLATATDKLNQSEHAYGKEIKSPQDRDTELQAQLDKISQYGAVKDMDKILKRFDEIENQVVHIKTGMHQQAEELKTSIQQHDISIMESQKGLETVNTTLKSLNTDLGNVDSKLETSKQKIHNMIRSPDFIMLQRAAGKTLQFTLMKKKICGQLR
jgi:chromosome segregation ATPase